ncbi:uncharacterized protein LOC132707008 [Cylas formicarius]|uniref:uncharacterized protein LOC132707008 n=1 Tax=Cylas formicarius TaxID=197179 RepID=UPI0029589F8C|nr:uncharacterized protein LOC132707008 [Cylas formicarius]
MCCQIITISPIQPKSKLPGMFCIKDLSSLNEDWVPYPGDGAEAARISNENLRQLKSHDVLAVGFLYQAYKNELQGVVLNEDTGINTKLQTAVFLKSLASSMDEVFWALVISPEKFLPYWHYHLTVQGKFKVKVFTPQTFIQDFFEESNLVILASFSNLKLIEHLKEYCFSVVIVDELDTVITKLIVKKLRGNFNIGLTRRNFYIYPDQKLHWNLLNWSNPGCVGKLSEFYSADNDNFANFGNRYRRWWFRLTWNFCDPLVPDTPDEIETYRKTVKDWALSNGISGDVQRVKSKKKVRKPGQNRSGGEQDGTSTTEGVRDMEARICDARRQGGEIQEDSGDSSDTTVIYEADKDWKFGNTAGTMSDARASESSKAGRVEAVTLETEEDSDDILKTFANSRGRANATRDRSVERTCDVVVTEADDFINSLVCGKSSASTKSAKLDYENADRILMEADKLLHS